jgi:hypothetical protein
VPRARAQGRRNEPPECSIRFLAVTAEKPRKKTRRSFL